LTQFWYKAL